MSKHTPGPWVWGDWTILDEDRPAQKRGDPYWTLVEGDEVLCQGPIGRKAMDTESIVWPVGYETEGIGANGPDMALISAAPELAQVAAWMLGILESPLPRAGSHEADDRRQETELACAAARLALAKAEGP